MNKFNIENVIPIRCVESAARNFLDECNGHLDFDGEIVSIPSDVEIAVASRAYVKEDIIGFTFGNHYQAKVVIGPEITKHGCFAIYGYLGIYFSEYGKVITQDWRK